jgi:AraC-like DNA-binding protein
LAFTIQLYVIHRRKIQQFFSNTKFVELNWIRNFLIVYCLLFLINFGFNIVEAIFTDLHYRHNWWDHLLSALALVYLGFMALYTNPSRIKSLHSEMNQHQETPIEIKKDYSTEAKKIEQYFNTDQVYLNHDLTLADVAKATGYSTSAVSNIINSHFEINFKEYVNRFRVAEIKKRLVDPKYDHISLTGIALDSGFSSKSTFNRVFKASTGLSPSEYKAQNRL